MTTGLDPSKLPGARRSEVPRFVSPQLATLVEEVPPGPDWAHEVKFDGYRALVRIEDGRSQILSRTQKDWTVAYDPLAVEAATLPVTSAILDGEVVALTPDGRTSFESLRHLARVPAKSAGKRPAGGGVRLDLAARLAFYAFDLLYLDGFDLTKAPLEERRKLLSRLLERAGGDRIRFSDHLTGDGPAILREACALGLEGVVSKRSGRPYRPGVRGPDWVKTKCRQEQEFVIGGFTDPAGSRVGFGALLLGVYEGPALRYVSKVGTGFDDRTLVELGERLRALETARPPFSTGLPPKNDGVHWVQPVLVAQISFMEWTSSGGIRHASFKGLREDKQPVAVSAEIPTPGIHHG